MLDNLPDDPKKLKEIIFQLNENNIRLNENNVQQNKILVQQSAVIDELNKELRRQKALNENIQHQLKQLMKRLYGPRSDKLSPNDLPLFDPETALGILNPPESEPSDSAVVDPSSETPRKPSNGHGRKPFPAHLTRKDIVLDIKPEEKVCSQCETEKKKIGEETSEQLEYVPASFIVLRHIRPIYACPKGCEGEVSTAPVPSKPIEKGIPGPGLLAHIAIRKYKYHDPLNRQEDMFRHIGMTIGRSTMCDWMASCADIGKLLVKRMAERVLGSHHINTDDTPVTVKDGLKDKRKTGRLWAYIGDEANPYIVYDYTPNRRRDGPKEFLKDYVNYLQADAYGGYDGIYSPDGITEVACWAHARRYFVEAQDTSLRQATEAVAYIRRLYDAEDAAKLEIQALPLDLSDTDRTEQSAMIRLRYRQSQSVDILSDFGEWLTEMRRDSLPKSPLGKAVSYALTNWDALKVYTTDGLLSIDNNAAERAMRPIALGRKNYLFFGSDKGGETAAILYSLIASADKQGLNPFEYLRDVLDRLPDTPLSRLDDFLPDRWKTLRQPTPPIDPQ